MGRSGTPADNAVAEAFFAFLQTELLDRSAWPRHNSLCSALLGFVEAFYSRRRRHGCLAFLSPDEYERKFYENQNHAPATSP